jgi:hypothetical protein
VHLLSRNSGSQAYVCLQVLRSASEKEATTAGLAGRDRNPGPLDVSVTRPRSSKLRCI